MVKLTDKHGIAKKVTKLRSSVRPAKKALISTTKKRIKSLSVKKEESKDPSTHVKFDKEIKSLWNVISCLRTLQSSEILKFGLRHDYDQMRRILLLGRADANTRAMARLCGKQIMQKAFQEFKVANPGWRKISIDEFPPIGAQNPIQTDEKEQNDSENKIKNGLKPKQIEAETSNNSDQEQDAVNSEEKCDSEEMDVNVKLESNTPIKEKKSTPETKKADSPGKKVIPEADTENVKIRRTPSKAKTEKFSPVRTRSATKRMLQSGEALKKRKLSDARSNSSFDGSTPVLDKTPDKKKVKFEEQLIKGGKTSSQPDLTPKSELKSIIKKSPSETKQKIQKPIKGTPRRRSKLRLS